MAIDISKLTSAELKELQNAIKEQVKFGVTAGDKVVTDTVDFIKAKAKETGVSVDKLLSVVTKIIKPKTKGSSGTRKISERVELQRKLKAAGVKTTPKTSTDELRKLAANL